MGRPTKLTEGGQNPIDWVKEVTYNVAGQITQMKYPRAGSSGYYLTETRSYNNRMEMTRLTVAGEADWEYRYSAMDNNGQITQMKDFVTGEEVTYQYDSLKRLVSAVTTGPDWGLSFSYDGFGNKTGQNVTKGTAPVMNLTYHEPTNRINPQHGFSYDANGNVTAMPSMTNTYDAANRLTQVMHNSTGTQQYGYAPDNKRVWHKDAQNQEFFQYYDVSGKRLGSYRITHLNYLTISYTSPIVAATNVYFGSKMIVSEGRTVILDRLGSVRLREPAGGCCLPFDRVNYFSYGEGMTSAARNFATYERSASTGVDYADQRYYSSIQGRFLTPDPIAPGNPENPSSWNYYQYVFSDPVNYVDPTGLECSDEEREHLTSEIERYLYGKPGPDGTGGQKGIIRRINEQIRGRYNPIDHLDEWSNHNRIIEGEQQSLRDLLDKWDIDDCGGPPGGIADARKWASRGSVKDWEYLGPGGETVKKKVVIDGETVVVTLSLAALTLGIIALSAPASGPIAAGAFLLGVVVLPPPPPAPARPSVPHVRSRVIY
jgi:RHS repeat-associated protein